MAERSSYENLVDPAAVFNFPKNFAAQIRDHEKQTKKQHFYGAHSLSSGKTIQEKVEARSQARAKIDELKFFDIDDLALIPFDSVDC